MDRSAGQRSASYADKSADETGQLGGLVSIAQLHSTNSPPAGYVNESLARWLPTLAKQKGLQLVVFIPGYGQAIRGTKEGMVPFGLFVRRRVPTLSILNLSSHHRAGGGSTH